LKSERITMTPKQISKLIQQFVCLKNRAFRLASKVFTSIIYQDRYQGGDLHKHLRCQKNVANAMANRIAGDVYTIASVLKNDQLSFTLKPVPESGRALRSSVKAIKALLPLLWSAKLNMRF
jgi:hypothetical protein